MEAPQNLPESDKSGQETGDISFTSKRVDAQLGSGGFIKMAWGNFRNAIIGCSAAVLFGVAILLLSIFSVTNPLAVFPQESASDSAEIIVTPAPTKVDYYLPYPGILPDNPLYKVKALRDKVRWWLTFDEGRKVQRELLYADKRINAALALVEGGKTDLGVDTATKAEKYLEQAVTRTIKLQKLGQDVTSLLLTLEKATAKHAEIIQEQIVPKVGGNQGIEKSMQTTKSLQDQVAQALREK